MERIASEFTRKVWITRNREKIVKKSEWDQDEGQEDDLEDNQRIRIEKDLGLGKHQGQDQREGSTNVSGRGQSGGQ